MGRRVALFGGSFNPPHAGHVLTVAWALSCLDVDRVLVVPTWSHAFGKRLASWDQRLEMLRAAMTPFAERVEISEIERTLGGESRTIHVVDALRENEPTLEIVLLMGTDILDELHLWKESERLQREVEVVVLPRGGYPSSDPRVRGPQLPEVSSTGLRSAVARGAVDDLRDVVPGGVVDIIARDGLYAEAKDVEDALGRRLWIVGAGRVGTAVGAAAVQAGWSIAGLWSRSESNVLAAHDALSALAPDQLLGCVVEHGELPATLDADVVFLAVVDDAIQSVALGLARALEDTDAVLLHASGSLSSAVLSALPLERGRIGSMHPLVAVPDAGRVGAATAASRLVDTFFAVEGGPRARETGKSLATACGARCVEIPSGAKTLYHASAVVVSNYVVTIFALGRWLLVESSGLEPSVAGEMLHRLLMTAAENLGTTSPAAALTGPVRRGDVATIRRHIAALGAFDRVLAPYMALLPETIRLAEVAGLPARSVELLKAAFHE